MVPDHADSARGLTVREVRLRDFRSYAELELELEPGVVLVSGPNGAGKTNFLEALHLGTQGFSPRARADAQMVRFGAETGRVHVSGERSAAPFDVDVTLMSRESRRAKLNGSALQSAEQLRGEFQTLVFTPDRLAVVKGAPAIRRAYLDRSLGRLFPGRATLPIEYASAVGQRNAALRRVAAGISSRGALAPWTDAVAGLGAALVAARAEVTDSLAGPFTACAEQLGLAGARMTYVGEAVSTGQLEERLDRDLDRGLTGAGPHLHDVHLEAAGRELRIYGSQGEQRVAVLALVLAETALLAERTGARPLLLLDDVLSELDADRRRALVELILDVGQTLVTTTTASALPIEPSLSLKVTPGSIRSL